MDFFVVEYNEELEQEEELHNEEVELHNEKELLVPHKQKEKQQEEELLVSSNHLSQLPPKENDLYLRYARPLPIYPLYCQRRTVCLNIPEGVHGIDLCTFCLPYTVHLGIHFLF
jgi:hypothetical protein